MELVQLIVQTKWNSRKQWETVGNSRKHDQDKTCPTRIFFKINISAPRRFFLRSKSVTRQPNGTNFWWLRRALKLQLACDKRCGLNLNIKFVNSILHFGEVSWKHRWENLGFDLVVRSNPFGLLICIFFFARFEVVTATLLDAWGPKIVLVKLTFLRWGGWSGVGYYRRWL